jgi:hypothetical protein
MVPATLLQPNAQLKSPIDECDRPSEVESLSREGAIWLRIGLDGSFSVQILADSSSEEKELRERLTVAWPAIELMLKRIHAFHTEPVGIGG